MRGISNTVSTNTIMFSGRPARRKSVKRYPPSLCTIRFVWYPIGVENAADAATAMAESVGGGGCIESGWGRKRDDDDDEWARRCSRKANWLCKPMRRSYRR